jgi:hypothetical protein
MLELQKITEFAKPTKLDRFKKHIKTQSNLDKEIKSFDFFKTSRTQKKKTLLGNIYFFVIAFIYLNACVGVILDMSNKDPISVEIDKTYEIYQKISNNLDEKNVIDIDSYYKLKSLPTSHADLLSSVIATKLLYNKKINPEAKDKALKIYAENYNSGIQQEKKQNTCTVSILCYLKAGSNEKYYAKIEDNLASTAIFARHPDIFQKHQELMDLQIKHQVRLSQ